MLYLKMQKPSDCFRTCVACLLDLDVWQVPDWTDETPPGEPMTPEARFSQSLWFIRRGLYLIETRFQSSGDQPNVSDLEARVIARSFSHLHPGLPFILSGQTIKGVVHANIFLDGSMIHDPAPVAQPIVHPANGHGGYYSVYNIGLSLDSKARHALTTFLMESVE